MLVSKSCSSGWQHLQTITGARGIASDLAVPLLLLASMATCMVLQLTRDLFVLYYFYLLAMQLLNQFALYARHWVLKGLMMTLLAISCAGYIQCRM